MPNYYETIKLIRGMLILTEIDKSKFGIRKYNKGHKVNGFEFSSSWKNCLKTIVLLTVDNGEKGMFK